MHDDGARRGYRFISRRFNGRSLRPRLLVGLAPVSLCERTKRYRTALPSDESVSGGNSRIVFVTGESRQSATALLDEFHRRGHFRVARPSICPTYSVVEGYRCPRSPTTALLGCARSAVSWSSACQESRHDPAAQAPTWSSSFPSLLKKRVPPSLDGRSVYALASACARNSRALTRSTSQARSSDVVLEDLQLGRPLYWSMCFRFWRRRRSRLLVLMLFCSPGPLAISAAVDASVDGAQESICLVHRLFREVVLGPILSDAYVSQFCRALLPWAILSSSLAKLIPTLGGNPLYVSRPLEHMSSRGLVSAGSRMMAAERASRS